MSIEAVVEREAFRTDVPALMDRLPWSRWHRARGPGHWASPGSSRRPGGDPRGRAVSPVLEPPPKPSTSSSTQNGLLNTSYLVGAVIGSLVFGYLTDLWGRKKLFTITLGVYLVAAFLTAFSWDFWSFAVFRFSTGAGIGGERPRRSSSAIDELDPGRGCGARSTWPSTAPSGWGRRRVVVEPIVLLDFTTSCCRSTSAAAWASASRRRARRSVVIFFRNSLPEEPAMD